MFFDIIQLPAAVIITAQSLLALAMLFTGIRIWKGPTIADRIIALDLMGSLIMAECVLLVFTSGFASYLNVAMAIAIISFMATVAFARYLEKKDAPI